MYTLFFRPTCPYCQKVLAYMESNGITADMRDVTEQSHADELLKRGGKRQVPFLVDDENDVAMYESDAIIAHLSSRSAG